MSWELKFSAQSSPCQGQKGDQATFAGSVSINGVCVHTVRQTFQSTWICHRKCTFDHRALEDNRQVLHHSFVPTFTIFFVPVLLGCPKFGLFLKSSQDAEILVQGMFLDGCSLNTSAAKSQERLQFYVTYDLFCISNSWDHMCVCVCTYVFMYFLPIYIYISCEFVYTTCVYTVIHTYVYTYVYISMYVFVKSVCVYVYIYSLYTCKRMWTCTRLIAPAGSRRNVFFCYEITVWFHLTKVSARSAMETAETCLFNFNS